MPVITGFRAAHAAKRWGIRIGSVSGQVKRNGKLCPVAIRAIAFECSALVRVAPLGMRG
jgi:hypothetical protein